MLGGEEQRLEVSRGPVVSSDLTLPAASDGAGIRLRIDEIGGNGPLWPIVIVDEGEWTHLMSTRDDTEGKGLFFPFGE